MNTLNSLKESTLRRYGASELLERDESGTPIYFHSSRCPSFCDFGCNVNGTEIAEAVERLESRQNEYSQRVGN